MLLISFNMTFCVRFALWITFPRFLKNFKEITKSKECPEQTDLNWISMFILKQKQFNINK